MKTPLFLSVVAALALTGTPAVHHRAWAWCPPCDKPEVTEMSDIPWTPAPVYTAPKVIYGEDDRIDVYAETDPARLLWASATCALISTSRLTLHGDGSATISSPSAYSRFGLPPCADEPFGTQPTAASCTGFMVGSDLIVTAGHCYNVNSLASVRFIFGFWMLDGATPRLTFTADEVYQGVEVVSYAPSGDYDHCVVRVDRPITAPGATPFALRREGVIEPGEYVGVIGHPAGLPMKIAFGNTYVRSSSRPGFFVANLDTYGGNSGSPVINATTGILEGILVRGETDYVSRGTCFASNVVPNDGGRGEDVTKATVFAEHAPDPGTHIAFVSMESAFYRCADVVSVRVVDLDNRGAGSVPLTMMSSGGDIETMTLLEEAGSLGTFTGAITLVAGVADPGSGLLEVSHDETIVASYLDAIGDPQVVEAEAAIDCVPPDLFDVVVANAAATQAQIQCVTSESARVTAYYGATCATTNFIATSAQGTTHVISLSGLTPDTRYHFALEAVDRAGNVGYTDNNGACFTLHTVSSVNHFTEYFNTQNAVDVRGRQVTFIPVDHPDRYQACVVPVTTMPLPVSGQELPLSDDGFFEVALDAGRQLPFYGTNYNRFFIGSNGFITFTQGDTSYQALPSQHFMLPRISAFMCDLNPEIRGAAHLVKTSDRYAITFVDVPSYDGTGVYPPQNSHTFQVELFFDGMIRITWMDLFAERAIVGLSRGLGTPANFASIKFRNLNGCDAIEYEGAHHSADTNGDWRISMEEVLRVVQFYNSGGYACDAEAADGFRAGDGLRDCAPHDGDYAPQDWRIDLGELLRIIQFYNASGYRPDTSSEDGFQPVP